MRPSFRIQHISLNFKCQGDKNLALELYPLPLLSCSSKPSTLTTTTQMSTPFQLRNNPSEVTHTDHTGQGFSHHLCLLSQSTEMSLSV